MALKGYLEIIRPINCAMMGLAVIVGGIIASGKIEYDIRLFLGFLTGFALAGVTNIQNDICDLEIDKINRPERPLPSGELDRRSATVWASFLLLVGLATAALTSTACLVVACLSTLLGFLYNAFIKRTGLLGNIVVAFIVSVPFIYGWLVVEGEEGLLIWLFSLTSFCAVLGREIAKGMADIEGDAQKGIRTIAVIRGMRKASATASALFIFSVILSFLPFLMRLVSTLYLVLVIPTDLGFIASTYKILREPTSRTAYVEKKRILVWMTLALFAFIAGGVM
ncbi:MAG: geranylgeranylglycerol-phosphate geranylgeranyltransferase [Thermoproteota archaeon]